MAQVKQLPRRQRVSGACINDRPAAGGRLNWIKWILIWIAWIGIIAIVAIRAGGYHAVDPFYNLEGM